MAGRINDDDVQALRERADVGAVIGEYTALKRAGTKLKGLCPFHNEKTPSFTVDPQRKLFHCFGCGEGGDVYHFLQKIEALSFPEAVERLARRESFTLRYAELSPGQRQALGRRTRLVEAVGAAATFYVDRLATAEGEPARRYLASRGLDSDAATHFMLGWAPDSWDTLSRHLISRDFSPEEVIEAGLATAGRNGPVDRFRGRVIFPIVDRGGKDVVAFGGRVLPGVDLATGPRDGTPPKYINSSETEIYKKSETLYGLNWARAEIQRRDMGLVVEGYMDVIGLHRAGVRYVVATCGTALTAEHFRSLEKFARRIVLALDADEAGFNAAERARALAEEAGLREVGVLPLPAGTDPADLAARGPEAVEEALAGVKTAVQFQIEHLLRGADVSTPEGQVEAYRRTFPLLARLGDRFLRFTYIRDVVAPAVRLSADRIERSLDDALRAGEVPAQTPPAPAQQAKPGGEVRRMGGMDTGHPRDPQLQLEREVLRAALQTPDLMPDAWDEVDESDFTAPASRQLFAALRSCAQGDLTAVLAALPDDDARARVRALSLSDSTLGPDPTHLSGLIRDLRAASIMRELTRVRSMLAQVNPDTDPEENRRLLTRLTELERIRRALVEGHVEGSRA